MNVSPMRRSLGNGSLGLGSLGLLGKLLAAVLLVAPFFSLSSCHIFLDHAFHHRHHGHGHGHHYAPPPRRHCR